MKSSYFLIVSIGFLSLFGCGWNKAITPPEPKGFVERRPEGSQGIRTDQTPYMYLWQNPDLDKEIKQVRDNGSYSLFIAPVGTTYLDFTDKDPKLVEYSKEVAVFLHEQIIEELNADDQGSLKVSVTQNESEADFLFEIELTEVGFGDPLLYTAAFFAPLPGTSLAVDAAITWVLSYEARILPTNSDVLVAELFDRRIAKVRPFDLRKMFTKGSPLRDIAGDMAEEIAAGLSARLDKDTVKGELPFSIFPI